MMTAGNLQDVHFPQSAAVPSQGTSIVEKQLSKIKLKPLRNWTGESTNQNEAENA